MGSSLSLFILCWNWISVSAKHILEKIAFHCELPYGLKHFIAFLLQFSLLSADFLFGLALVENTVRIFHEFCFPSSEHVGVQVVVCSDLAEFPIALKNLRDDLGFEFWCVLS